MKDTDTFLALSPSIGACVYSIVFANEEENEAFAHSAEPSTFLANILNTKDKDFFDEKRSKYIVTYFTELLISQCQDLP